MKPIVLVLSLIALSALPLAAEGAGGVDFYQVVGRDLWGLPGASGLPAATGQISAVGGSGYGVDEEGTMVGGFGLGVTSRNLSLTDSPTGTPVTGFHAGYGGMMSGWQHRWGPIVGQAVTRIGFGGADWSSVAGFSMLGMADLQVGLMLFPWFNLAVSGGVAGTLTLVSGQPLIIGYAPTLGLHLHWGAY